MTLSVRPSSLNTLILMPNPKNYLSKSKRKSHLRQQLNLQMLQISPLFKYLCRSRMQTKKTRKMTKRFLSLELALQILKRIQSPSTIITSNLFRTFCRLIRTRRNREKRKKIRFMWKRKLKRKNQKSKTRFLNRTLLSKINWIWRQQPKTRPKFWPKT